jgi:hypothetical protein
LNFCEKNEGGKTCSNLKFFVPLKISLRVDIESELAFFIWNYELGLMAKSKVEKKKNWVQMTSN